MGPCAGTERDLLFEKSGVGLTRTEEFSYGPLFSSERQGTNKWKTADYIDPKRRAIVLEIMHILRPARMRLLTREEEKQFPKERKILTAESSEGTKDDIRRPSIPPQPARTKEEGESGDSGGRSVG
ncbi:hypothetical protein AXG93_1847s1560 [Marchantia polymorpha subsp. ruderalis]|uniref:Uncharacterized protein n=1 Tax=Marchantia polymorpha subsp. ruderalis TaxID=1480154 RepID=A0A176VFQ2_MARPO|nr:hypothetical protein AXG93_1847s1560 [Marchantia polymorpha subsp. ruderalis]